MIKYSLILIGTLLLSGICHAEDLGSDITSDHCAFEHPLTHMIDKIQAFDIDEEIPDVSIIIPTLNDEHLISQITDHLKSLTPQPEILIVDGGSTDNTLVQVWENCLSPICVSRANKSLQFNAGIDRAKGDILLFLDIGTTIDQESYSEMLRQIDEKELLGGAFSLLLSNENTSWKARILEYTVRLRNALFALPLSNQAYFVRKEALKCVGYFDDIPLMGDIQWFKRLKKTGRYSILKSPVTVSSNLESQGSWLTHELLNSWYIFLYQLGVSPKKLAEMYERRIHATEEVPDICTAAS